jgi:4,5-dihydroxyphthalate decarboxylase
MATAVALSLKSAVGNYGHVLPIKQGSVRSERLDLSFVEIEPITRAFRRMCSALEFDFCEMAFTTYAQALDFGKPITGLPIVVARGFHHGSISYNTRSGIKHPSELAGKRIGIRAYSQTTGVWVRGILQDEYGLDPNSVTWVTVEGSHVEEYQDPPNVVRVSRDRGLAELLDAGEIEAGIGLTGCTSPDVQPLIPNVAAAQADWFARPGIYPVNHMVVVQERLSDQHPWLAGEIFDLFKRSKEQYLGRLRGGVAETSEDRRRLESMKIVGDDPLPYGLEANRAAMELGLRYAVEQKLVRQAYSMDELFDENARGLV